MTEENGEIGTLDQKDADFLVKTDNFEVKTEIFEETSEIPDRNVDEKSENFEQVVVPETGNEMQSEVGDTGQETEKHDQTAIADPIPSPENRIQSATVWTRKDIKEFKELIKKEQPGNMLKIGHGETATVRVPTHPDGARLYWEFATDYYDLGFGVYFEWSVPETDEIVVQISESDDEDEDEENDYDGGQSGQGETANDIEGRPQRKERKPVGPPVDEILPIYRRDCHEEVHAGSHPYPGVGVYLLKFDNTYSLWRSKYLYYRVYYGD